MGGVQRCVVQFKLLDKPGRKIGGNGDASHMMTKMLLDLVRRTDGMSASFAHHSSQVDVDSDAKLEKVNVVDGSDCMLVWEEVVVIGGDVRQ